MRPQPYIFYGKPVALSTYPWYVKLRIQSGDNFSFCGAFFITRRDMLTAAHCVHNAKDIMVIENNIYSIPTWYAIHDKYYPITLENDIALVHIANDFDGSLPQLPWKDFTLQNGVLLRVIGNGRTEDGSFLFEENMQHRQVDIPYVEDCSWGQSILFGDMCVGGGIEDACNGDSGSPLFVNEELPLGRKLVPNVWDNTTSDALLVGIVSRGYEECGVYPGIYTDLRQHLSWIRTYTRANSVKWIDETSKYNRQSPHMFYIFLISLLHFLFLVRRSQA